MEEWEREVCHSIIVAAGRNRNNRDGGSTGRDKKTSINIFKKSLVRENTEIKYKKYKRQVKNERKTKFFKHQILK